MSLPARSRSRIGALAVAALALGGLVAATPASADEGSSAAALRWGFRHSFRSYVGNPANTVERPIAPQSPAAFDGGGSSVTRPYTFPVASGSIADAQNFSVSLAGGVTYSYPAHTFTIDLSDITVRVVAGRAEVLADVRVETTSPEFVPVAENDVVLGASDAVTAEISPTDLDLSVTGLELSASGAAALQDFLAAGSALDDLELSAPVVDGKIASTPYLSVLGDEIGTAATEIGVRGYGFEYGLKEINYGPGMAGVVGPYVRLGTVDGEWRPSAGAGATTRTNVDQIWAVEPALLSAPAIGSQGGVAFEEDGSFAGSLSGAAGDFEGKSGFSGIYSYVTNPAITGWETFAALAVVGRANELPVVAALPSAVVADEAADVTITAKVSGANALQWERLQAAAGAQWETVVGATSATLKLPRVAFAGSGTKYRVSASNDVGSATSTATTLKVKAKPTVRIAVKKSFRFASKTKATISVTAPAGVAASGKVTVRAGKAVVGSGTVTGGKASVTLSTKLVPGSRALVAQFAGSADLTAASSPAVTVKVAKATAKVTAKLAKKSVKAGKRAALRVKVKATGVKPTGKVRIVVSKGKKVVRTLTAKVKRGKTVSVRLPRLAKGKYTVKATFQGSKTVAKKSAKKVTLRVR